MTPDTSATHRADAVRDYMHARYYSPVEGRFLSTDPILKLEGALHSPQSWNRYAYGLLNPLKYTDPDGKANTVVVFSVLPDDPFWGIRESVDDTRPYLNAVTDYQFDGRYGLTKATALAGFKRLDSTDLAILESHGGGPNFQSQFADGSRETFNDRNITLSLGDSGRAPRAVILAGCSTQEAAKHINTATGIMTFGTTAGVQSNEGTRAAAVLATALAATGNVNSRLSRRIG